MEPETSRPAAARWGMLLATSAVVVPAEAAFRAWSVDLAAGRAYPMAGAVRIRSARP